MIVVILFFVVVAGMFGGGTWTFYRSHPCPRGVCMIRSVSLFVLSIFLPLISSPAPAEAGFILDPNSGSYSSSDTPSRPVPTSLAEKLAAATSLSDLNTALADYNKYYRFYRYAFVGVGGKQGSVEQGGVTGSWGTGFAGTVGFDFDGLQWTTPHLLELRGNFGFSPPVGETAIFWYLSGPVSRALWNKEYDIPNPINGDLRAGVPFGKAVQRNGAAIPDWAEQFIPIKLELGVGYQGISFEQDGGTIVDGGAKVKNRTTGMVAGLAYAVRVGYFGEQNMVRLTGYYLKSNSAKTGGVFQDALSGFGGTMEMDATTKGKMIEGKLDWYHRLDERVRTGSWISGYGLSLIGRQIHLDQGQTTQVRSFTGSSVTTIFPEQDIRQVELLATVGFMR